MNQNRKCCILVDDAFVRSPLGIIKFVSNMIVKKREGFSLDGWTLKELMLFPHVANAIFQPSKINLVWNNCQLLIGIQLDYRL